MSRGGHKWKGSGMIEGTRSLDAMKLARAGYLCGSGSGGWQWSYQDGSTASIGISRGRDAINLKYRFQSNGGEWQSVEQCVPIRWTPCRFGGERPWFICGVHCNGVYCGRQVTKIYGGGKLFACRHCYRLGYQVQRGGPMEQAHHRLRRLHQRLGANYDGPDGLPPPRPKWMRWRTYEQIVRQIQDGEDHLDVVFMAGAQGILARIERSEQRGSKSR